MTRYNEVLYNVMKYKRYGSMETKRSEEYLFHDIVIEIRSNFIICFVILERRRKSEKVYFDGKINFFENFVIKL